MRISNPKLFNGQHLATREDITKWLSGGVVTDYGNLQIPVSGIVGLTAEQVTYNITGTVAAQIANIYTKLGLDNSGGGGDETLLSRVATIENAIKVAANGNYIVSGSAVNTNLGNLDTNLKTVSGDLDALEVKVGTLSDKFDGIDHKTLTIGNTTYDTESDAVVTTADLVVLGALTGVVAGNEGIAVSEKADGQVSVSAVVKEGDLHLGIGENGIETSGLTVDTNGNYIQAATAVSGNLVALDTQVKANADAIEKHGDAIRTAITFEEVSLSGLADDSSVTVEGRIMQVFDADGWVYPEVKFTTNGEKVSSTVTITEWNTISDKTALSGLSGLVSKKVIITE